MNAKILQVLSKMKNEETEKLTKISRNRIAEKNEAKRKLKNKNSDEKTKMDRYLKTNKN